MPKKTPQFKHINSLLNLAFKTFLVLMFSSAFLMAHAGIDHSYQQPSSNSWGNFFSKIYSKLTLKNSKSYALIIGISNFDHHENLLSAKDAERVKNQLLSHSKFDYVHLLTEEKVTVERVSALINQISGKLKGNDRFLFYWSGHGVTRNFNGRQLGYLPLKHSREDQYASMINMEKIKEWDRKIRAKHALFIIDSCFSGLAGIVAKSSMRKLTMEQFLQPSHQLLTAGTGREQTITIDGVGSIFTQALLNGMQGHADSTMGNFTKDGIVSTSELKAYIQKYVAKHKDHYGWNKTITALLHLPWFPTH